MVSSAVFWPALWIGLSIAAPVGLMGLPMIQRTLRHGAAVGLAPGLAPRLGTAVADAAYGAMGAFGVSALIAWLQAARMPLGVPGGVFLCAAVATPRRRFDARWQAGVARMAARS